MRVEYRTGLDFVCFGHIIILENVRLGDQSKAWILKRRPGTGRAIDCLDRPIWPVCATYRLAGLGATASLAISLVGLAKSACGSCDAQWERLGDACSAPKHPSCPGTRQRDLRGRFCCVRACEGGQSESTQGSRAVLFNLWTRERAAVLPRGTTSWLGAMLDCASSYHSPVPKMADQKFLEEQRAGPKLRKVQCLRRSLEPHVSFNFPSTP